MVNTISSSESRRHRFRMRQFSKKFIDSTAILRQVEAAIAFELHFLEHDKYPTAFESLIPEFLDAIPIDPWTDKPMLLDFRPDGRPVIYSVGEDLDDDGGIPQSHQKPRDGDIVWHYLLPAGFDVEAHYEK